MIIIIVTIIIIIIVIIIIIIITCFLKSEIINSDLNNFKAIKHELLKN